ncbi:MAG: hypothetical protein J6023_07460 [Clostridia bacterium]|nr:hypothetical protein [Clostridia bacterium]
MASDKNKRDAQELEALLAKMRAEADADETPEEEETTRPQGRAEQNIQQQIRDILSRHEDEKGSKKARKKSGQGSSHSSDSVDEDSDEDSGEYFTADDFESDPEEKSLDESASEPEKVPDEPAPEPEEDSGTEETRKARAHLEMLREQRMASGHVEDETDEIQDEIPDETTDEVPEEIPDEPIEDLTEKATEEELPEDSDTEEKTDTSSNPFDDLYGPADDTPSAEDENADDEPIETEEEEPETEVFETEDPRAFETFEPYVMPGSDEDGAPEEEVHSEGSEPEPIPDEPVDASDEGWAPNPEALGDEPAEEANESLSDPDEGKITEDAQLYIDTDVQGGMIRERAIVPELEETPDDELDETVFEKPVQDLHLQMSVAEIENQIAEELEQELSNPELMWGTKESRARAQREKTDDTQDRQARLEVEQASRSDSAPKEAPALETAEDGNPSEAATEDAQPTPDAAPPKPGEMSDEDALMLRDLGLEEEVVRMVGKKRYDEIIQNDLEIQKAYDPDSRPSSDFDGSVGSIEETAKKIKQRKVSLVIRLVLTSFLTVLTFILDQVGLAAFAGAFGITTQVTHGETLAFGLLFLLVAILISLFPMGRGARGFFTFNPGLWTPAFLMTVSTVIYDLLLFSLPETAVLPLLHTPAAVSMTWTVIAELFGAFKEGKDFEVVSDGEIKYCLKPLPHRKKVRLDEDGKVSYVRDLDEDGLKLGVSKTRHVRNFIRTSRSRPKSLNAMRPLIYILPLLAIITSVVLYAFRFRFGTGADDAYLLSVQCFGLLLMSSAPICMIVGLTYAHMRASSRLHEYGASLIGYNSGMRIGKTRKGKMTDQDPTTPAEPQNKTYIVFRDEYMFRQMMEVRIRPMAFVDPREGLVRLAAIASEVGGDMKRFLDYKAMPPEDIGQIEIVKYKTGGFVCNYSRLPGKLLYFGNASFMADNEIKIPDELIASELNLEADVARLYMATNNMLEFSLDLVYMPAPEFVERAAELERFGLYSAIQSYDPSLSDGFMDRMWSDRVKGQAGAGRRFGVEVYKPFNYEEDYATIAEQTDLVADSEDALCEAVLTDRQLVKEQGRSLRRAWLGAAIAFGLVLIFALSGNLNWINGLTVAVYQSVWAILTVVFDPWRGIPGRMDEETKAWYQAQRERDKKQKELRKQEKEAQKRELASQKGGRRKK